jgi:hypothetical protein
MYHPSPKVPRNKYTTGETNILTQADWSRIWSVQHIIIASKIAVMCGSATVVWNILIPALKSIKHGLTEMKRHKIGQSLTTILGLDEKRRRRVVKSIQTNALVIRFRQLQATDPRDKIYALLGLTEELLPKELSPDYSKSVVTSLVRMVRVFKGVR